MGYIRTQIIITALQGGLPEHQRAVMKPSCSCCPKQKQGSASSKAPTFGWNLCSSSPSVQEMGRMRVAVAWQPPACAPEPLRPRSHLSLSAQHSCPWAQMARPGGDSGGKSPQCLPLSSQCPSPSRWIPGCRSQWKKSRGFSHVCLGARNTFGSNLLYTASSSPSFHPALPRAPWPH